MDRTITLAITYHHPAERRTVREFTAMPTESRHHLAGLFQDALVLAVVAGFVDAFVFTHVSPVFVANMSGNFVRLGMAIGDNHWKASVGNLIVLSGFLAGTICATFIVDASVSRLDDHEKADPVNLMLLETVLLTLTLVVILPKSGVASTSLDTGRVVALLLASMSMGVQAITLRRVGEVAVSTTYGTGALVRLGEKVSLSLRNAPADHGVSRATSIMIIGSLLVAYVIGAVVADFARGSNAYMGLAPACVFAVSLHTRLRRPRAASA